MKTDSPTPKLRPKWRPGEQARAFAKIKAMAHKVYKISNADAETLDVLGPLMYGGALSHATACRCHVGILSLILRDLETLGLEDNEWLELLREVYHYCDGNGHCVGDRGVGGTYPGRWLSSRDHDRWLDAKASNIAQAGR